MQVTTLIENKGPEERADLRPEFGLSLHIEHQGSRVLFDAGDSGVFADNAAALGVDLTAVDAAVLSHQHYDHGGGLERFLELNQRASVYLRDSPLRERRFEAEGEEGRDIGIDPAVVQRHAGRFERISGERQLMPGIFALTDIGAWHPRPRGNRWLLERRDGQLQPDRFEHELLLVVRSSDGLVVFTGCSHSGVLNMIDTARARFPGEPIKAVFGGFHLLGLPHRDSMAASREEVEALGRQIAARVSGAVYTGHCTGDKALAVLEAVMAPTLRAFHTGTSVEV